MLAYKIQMPGNYPEESIQHSEHGKSLKSKRKENIFKMTIGNNSFHKNCNDK
jgi:hypothetical protein